MFQVLETYVKDRVNVPKMKWVNDVFMGGKKISGVLPKAENKGEVGYVWIGIGVNINLAPIEGSTCLKEQLNSTEDLDVTQFISKLNDRLFENISRLKEGGFNVLKDSIEQKLEYVGEQINIYDLQLQNVLHTGVFKGIDNFGHVMLEVEGGKTISVMDGKMRKATEDRITINAKATEDRVIEAFNANKSK